VLALLLKTCDSGSTIVRMSLASGHASRPVVVMGALCFVSHRTQ
jgi:hypothetical protein